MLNLMYQGIDKVMVYKDNLLEICWKFQDVFAELEGGEMKGMRRMLQEKRRYDILEAKGILKLPPGKEDKNGCSEV